MVGLDPHPQDPNPTTKETEDLGLAWARSIFGSYPLYYDARRNKPSDAFPTLVMFPWDTSLWFDYLPEFDPRRKEPENEGRK